MSLTPMFMFKGDPDIGALGLGMCCFPDLALDAIGGASECVDSDLFHFCEFVLSWWEGRGRGVKDGMYGSPFMPASPKWIPSSCAILQIP